MSGELEDFLRRAAQRRAENAAARSQRPQPPRRPEYTQRDRERVMTSSDPDDEIVVADLVQSQPVEERPRRMSVGNESAEAIRQKLKAKLEQASAAHSREGRAGGSEHREAASGQGNLGQSNLGLGSLGQGNIGQGNVGQGVGLLGQMAREPEAVTGTSGGSPALQAVLRLIHDPHGVDQAILAREILDRPTHRWE